VTILYPNPVRVNRRPFGAGLLPAPRIRWHGVDLRPLKAVPVGDGWHAEDAEYDKRAGEAGVMDRYEAGLIGHEVADLIAGTTLVGHEERP
jgi:hypothetical protein